MTKKLWLAAAVVVIALAAVGCGEKFSDAPLEKRWEEPAEVIEMPDQYNNIATKCVPMMPGYRMFVSSNDQSTRPVIVEDPSCGAAAPGGESK